MVEAKQNQTPGNETVEDRIDGHEVTAIKASDASTSGEKYEVYVVDVEDREKAEETVLSKSGVRRVDRELTVSFQYNENGQRVY